MDQLSQNSFFFFDSFITSINMLDIIGIIGFGIYIINYSLVTFQKINSHGTAFFSTNILAACCVLTSLTQSFNLASALIQVFWICLGIVAIALRIFPRSAKSHHIVENLDEPQTKQTDNVYWVKP